MSDSALWADTAAELTALAAREHVTQFDSQDAMERAAAVVRDLGRRAEFAEAVLQGIGYGRCACGRWFLRAGGAACAVCEIDDEQKARAA